MFQVKKGTMQVNTDRPGFPLDTPMGPSVDHSADISAAQARHLAARNPSQKSMSSANHHLSKERRSRPGSMETGTQILDGQKGKQSAQPSPGKDRKGLAVKMGFPNSGGKGNASMPAPSLGKLMPKM